MFHFLHPKRFVRIFREACKNIADKLFLLIARHLPLQNKIVFCNHGGDGLGDDPKYILLELLKRKSPAKLIWMLNDLSTPLPEGVKGVKYASVIAQYHLHTAKIWLYNYRTDFKVDKRNGQYYIQCWHGSFANKMVEKDTENTLPEEYVVAAKRDGLMTDLMYSNNEFKINLFKNRFWYNGEVIRSDSPQLSVVINPPVGLREKVFIYFNLPADVKLVIYAPTLNSDISIYQFNYERVLQSLETRFGGKFLMLLRLHPAVVGLASKLTYSKNVIPASSYPDMDELIAVADVMISDFSGVMYDMGFVRKPVFMFAKHYDDFIKNQRHQYFPPNKLPFEISRTEDELVQNILNFNQVEYENRLGTFYNMIGMSDSGQGARTIATIVQSKLTKNEKSSNSWCI